MTPQGRREPVEPPLPPVDVQEIPKPEPLYGDYGTPYQSQQRPRENTYRSEQGLSKLARGPVRNECRDRGHSVDSFEASPPPMPPMNSERPGKHGNESEQRILQSTLRRARNRGKIGIMFAFKGVYLMLAFF